MPVLNILQREPLWLMNGKRPGKICRRGPFLPVRAPIAIAAPNQKMQPCHSLGWRDRFGTAFAYIVSVKRHIGEQ
jgi:hypothetical protein